MNRKEKDFISYLRSSHKRGELIWTRTESPRSLYLSSPPSVKILTTRIDGYVITLTHTLSSGYDYSGEVYLCAKGNLESDFSIRDQFPGFIDRRPIFGLWREAEKSVRAREELTKSAKIQRALNAFALTIP